MITGLVSVLLPNYNGHNHLKESIDSVLKQSYNDIELIVIDDESNDNSRDIINSYQDERVKAIYLKKGRHISYALNKGMEMASGEFIARIDSDDVWVENKLEKQILYLKTNPHIAACFTKIYLIDKEGERAEKKYKDIYDMYENANNKTQKEWIKYFFKEGNCLCHSSVLMRRKMLDEIDGYYKLPYVTAEDLELWMRMTLKFPIYILNDKLVKYRWETSEVKVSGNDDQAQNAFLNVKMLIKKHFLDTITNDEFTEYFSDEFVNPNSHSDLELECEKAFLLLKDEKNNINFLGLQRIEKILNTTNGLELLEEKYGFDLRKYYKKYKVRNFIDPIGIKKIKVHDELMNEIERRQKYIEDLELLIKQYQDKDNDLELLVKQYQKKENDLQVLIKQYQEKEENFELSIKQYQDKIQEVEKNFQDIDELLNIKVNENDRLRKVVELQENEIKEKKNMIEELQIYITRIEESVSWKITKPMRKLGNMIK